MLRDLSVGRLRVRSAFGAALARSARLAKSHTHLKRYDRRRSPFADDGSHEPRPSSALNFLTSVVTAMMSAAARHVGSSRHEAATVCVRALWVARGKLRHTRLGVGMEFQNAKTEISEWRCGWRADRGAWFFRNTCAGSFADDRNRSQAVPNHSCRARRAGACSDC